jgi:ATP-binding cassette subfamily C protein
VDGALAATLGNPELTEGVGVLPAVARRWAREQAEAVAAQRAAAGRAQVPAGLARAARLALQGAVMILGGALIVARIVTPGSLMGANLLLGKALGPFDHLVASWRHWALAWAAWRRVDTMLALAPAEVPVAAQDEAGLVLEGVTVRADSRALLDDITLAVPPGTLLGVAGPNGAGKSTLLRLLAGLSRPDTGQARLDGVAVHDPARPPCGYLPQGVALLDGTVAENIARFAGGAAVAVAAARDAGVHDAIGRLPRGYETALHDGGAGMPGGLCQRIGLARALYGTPRLVVLDEPDANLDNDGALALRAALQAVRDAGAIVVVTTHRPALLAAMDRVLVLRDGRVASFGPPAANEAAARAVAG